MSDDDEDTSAFIRMQKKSVTRELIDTDSEDDASELVLKSNKQQVSIFKLTPYLVVSLNINLLTEFAKITKATIK